MNKINKERLKHFNLSFIFKECLYEMKESGRIEFKKISDKKYLYKLPESFNKNEIKNIAIYARVSTPKQKKI